MPKHLLSQSNFFKILFCENQIRKLNFTNILFKKKYTLIFIGAGIFFGWQLWQSFFDAKVVASQEQNFSAEEVKITITDNDLNFNIFSKAKTVGEFISEQKIFLGENDLMFPDKDGNIYNGTHIIIQRAKKITVKEGGKNIELYTFQNTIEKALWENKDIDLGEDDVTIPVRNLPVANGMKIVVTHVLIKEETKNIDIPFKTTSNEDDKLGWRIKKVTQKGVIGTKEVKYKVVYNDGKEISRKILESNVVSSPVDEIVTQGTFVKIGKVHTGVASWYAFKGGLFAANPWLPMGSYVRVTNRDNGKSVIVKINDRGPFGNGRIIDLDKVAFSQIASVGAGVANIKMEVVTN